MKRLSIRWRLTLWNTAVLLLVLVVFSVLFLVQIRRHLQVRADQSLREEVNELFEAMSLFADREQMLKEMEKRFSVHSHYHFQVFDEHRTPVFVSRFLTHITLPEPADPGLVRGASFSDIELPHLGMHRMLDQAVRDSESRPLLVRAIMSSADSERDFAEYVWMVLTLCPVALLCSSGIAYALAGYFLSPIKCISEAAKRIAAEAPDERLLVANEHDEVGELSKTLNMTFDALRNASQQMQRFTSDAAHELRSPITVLRTEAEVALRKPRSSEEYRQVVEVTLAETIRLGVMVDQLLTLSRHDAGLMLPALEEVSVDAVLHDVVESFATNANEKQIDVRVGELPNWEIRGHDVWLAQLFSNLVENALKFTPAGGSVRIYGTANGRTASFVIEDSGIGVAAEHIPFVFDRFYRVDSSREHYCGTGLGLAICKSIADVHRGGISVESPDCGGTRFIVSLPTIDALGKDVL